MYVRVKRLTQRQRLTRWRPWITLTIFPMLLWLLAMSAFVPPAPPQPLKLLWLAGGIAAGTLLALYGLKRTKFDIEPGVGLFYTHDARLGFALSAVFIVRVLYRMGELLLAGPQAADGAQFVLSPYTLAPVGLFSGYYIAYAVGLLRWRRRVLRKRTPPGV